MHQSIDPCVACRANDCRLNACLFSWLVSPRLGVWRRRIHYCIRWSSAQWYSSCGIVVTWRLIGATKEGRNLIILCYAPSSNSSCPRLRIAFRSSQCHLHKQAMKTCVPRCTVRNSPNINILCNGMRGVQLATTSTFVFQHYSHLYPFNNPSSLDNMVFKTSTIFLLLSALSSYCKSLP